MARVDQNITIHAGASYNLFVTLKEADGTTPLSEVAVEDLHYRIAQSAGAEEAIVSIDAPQLQLNGNVLKVPLTPTHTKAVPAQQIYHEVYLVENGVRNVLMAGSVTVQPRQLARHL